MQLYEWLYLRSDRWEGHILKALTLASKLVILVDALHRARRCCEPAGERRQ